MDEMTEDRRLVAEALHCADTGSAGHWPTVAGILAAEVRDLRDELDECRRGYDAHPAMDAS